MKHCLALFAVSAALVSTLTGGASQIATTAAGAASASTPLPAATAAVVADAVETNARVAATAALAAAPAARAPAKTPAPKATTATMRPAVAVSTAAARTAYLTAMYVSVVPAGQRAALAGRYVFGYNLAGLSCGSGCTGLFNGQARSSFNAAFFAMSLAYQRNTLAHEAAHAYGFLFFANYARASWAGISGWQARFHVADRGFVATFDAEAWAACVAWKETGFNNRVDQVANVCTPQAAALAMAHIS